MEERIAEPAVLYDPDCWFCKTLAIFLSKLQPDLEFQPISATPQSLGFRFADGKIIWGEEAWIALLENYPHFAGLNWLAEKLGMKPVLGKAMQKTGSVLRRFCLRCGK